MARPATADHRSKAAPKTRNVRMAVMTGQTDDTGAGQYTCNCGWKRYHVRAKVAERAAAEHVKKKHRDRAMWL